MEEVGDDLLCQICALPANGPHVPPRQREVDRDDGEVAFGVGEDLEDWFIAHLARGSDLLRCAFSRRVVGKSIDDLAFEFVGREVSDDDDRHQVRSIPAVVEVAEVGDPHRQELLLRAE